MKAVLMSIQAEHNQNIEKGLKLAELRTKPPKIDTPFKVYTYESGIGGRHKITNEWICKDVKTWRMCMGIPAHLSKVACVSDEYIRAYSGNGKKDIAELKISDLVIYDEPKELLAFSYPCKKDCDTCKYNRLNPWASLTEPVMMCQRDVSVAPQSWCYVEELK